MTEPYGLPPGTTINYGQPGFPPWVDELCREWDLDSSTYAGHQEGDRPDIGSAPNPDGLNRGIDWSGDPQRMLDFAHWLVSIAPVRPPGYGVLGIEMVIYQSAATGESVWYPDWVDFSGDLPNHRDHVHTRFSASIIDVAPAPTPQAMTVPLTDNGDGTWTSPSPAWAHLIMRESGGDPTIIQQIVDINSGGNEAEGLFQITPATWRAHGGTEFAPTARAATPQQQAIVAARIFTRNPTGSDWGAGLAGREDAAELAAGLVAAGAPPPPPPPPPEEGFLSALTPEEQRNLYDRLCGPIPSLSPLRALGQGNVGSVLDLMHNTDGSVHVLVDFLLAWLGHPAKLAELRSIATADPALWPDRQDDRALAQDILNRIADLESVSEDPSPPSTTAANGPTPVPPGLPFIPTGGVQSNLRALDAEISAFRAALAAMNTWLKG